MIYTISEEKKPISSCISELESTFNSDSNSDNDNNKNTGFSSIQYGNNNGDDWYSNSNSDSNYKQYITFPDLTKEQELRWFSNNGKSIMPERAYNTDAGFDLRYSGKEAIKLEPNLCTYIDLKIALKILATTMI
ncbi:hypothetical protein G9A89_017093 [Geosiphon pyriformis]|nr:hypothetical protein G9A89_017093 [Geosiphon pyriformis]